MKEKNNLQKHFNVKEIKDPSFLRSLKYKELDILSNDIRDYIVDEVSKNGGHLSSNLGVVELTIALHRKFDFKKDKIIYDVGHQCYTHKILTGRSLEGLRHKGKVAGFQKICESEYDIYEAGHSSTSISAASGFALARDANKEKYDVIAFIGDSSIVSGMAFEALNYLGGRKEKVIIILNDNDMSISRPVGGLGKLFRKISVLKGYNKFKSGLSKILNTSKFGSWILDRLTNMKSWFKRHLVQINIFDNLGLKYIGPIDGHNIKALEKALDRAKKMPSSVVVHVNTTKGKGYKYSEKDRDGSWHGVNPFDKETGKPLNVDENKITWSRVYANLLDDELNNRQYAYLISPATIKGAELDDIFKKYTSRCIDTGICEEHAVTLASGLSANHKHPIVSIYSTFMQRAFDQISHDIARMNLNSTFLVDRSGLVGLDGDTHQGIYDEAFLLSTPNTTVSMASNPNIAKNLLIESFNCHGPFFIRYPRGMVDKHYDNVSYPLLYGKWIVDINNSSNNVVIGFGPIYEEVKDKILKENLNVTLVNAVYQSPMDEELIIKLINKKKIFVFDAYGTREGFSNKLLDKLNSLGYKGEYKSYAIGLEFVKQATVNEQLFDYELTSDQIVDNIKKYINN